MRRYGSFLVRWWQLGPEEGRLHIRHVQSDTELIVAALPEALAWMRGCVGMADRAPPPVPTADELRGGEEDPMG